MKITKALINRVNEIQSIIDRAKNDDVYAIEPDSTWESMYIFESIELMKYKVKITYTELYASGKQTVDSIPLKHDDDIRYSLSWVKRSIKKGYRSESIDF